MKKVILSMVCLFAISTVANAAILAERDCVEEAIQAGNEAEEQGWNFDDAYQIASDQYERCQSGVE